MYTIYHTTYDQICMTAKATTPDGRTVDVKASWYDAPNLTWHNVTDKTPIYDWQWSYVGFYNPERA